MVMSMVMRPMPGLLGAVAPRDCLSMRVEPGPCRRSLGPLKRVVSSGPAPGSSSARLECRVRDREVGSSNLPFPTVSYRRHRLPVARNRVQHGGPLFGAEGEVQMAERTDAALSEPKLCRHAIDETRVY